MQYKKPKYRHKSKFREGLEIAAVIIFMLVLMIFAASDFMML